MENKPLPKEVNMFTPRTQKNVALATLRDALDTLPGFNNGYIKRLASNALAEESNLRTEIGSIREAVGNIVNQLNDIPVKPSYVGTIQETLTLLLEAPDYESVYQATQSLNYLDKEIAESRIANLMLALRSIKEALPNGTDVGGAGENWNTITDILNNVWEDNQGLGFLAHVYAQKAEIIRLKRENANIKQTLNNSDNQETSLRSTISVLSEDNYSLAEKNKELEGTLCYCTDKLISLERELRLAVRKGKGDLPILSEDKAYEVAHRSRLDLFTIFCMVYDIIQPLGLTMGIESPYKCGAESSVNVPITGRIYDKRTDSYLNVKQGDEIKTNGESVKVSRPLTFTWEDIPEEFYYRFEKERELYAQTLDEREHDAISSFYVHNLTTDEEREKRKMKIGDSITLDSLSQEIKEDIPTFQKGMDNYLRRTIKDRNNT